MKDHQYNGPRVRRTPLAEHQVKMRADELIEAQARLRYADAIREWSQQSTGRFPDRAAILAQVREELETVCRALDGWAAVDPDEVFGPVATNAFWHYD
jgi:hypothetical protein